MSLSSLSKLQKHADEIFDMFWLSLQALKTYRQESPYFDAIAIVFALIVFITLGSLVKHHLKKK